MAAPLSYKNDSQADERLNPAEELNRREQRSAFDDIAKNYDQTADDTQENANIAKARNQEQAGSGFKVDMGSIQDAGHKLASAMAGPGIPGQNKFAAQLRKNGPVGAIVAAVMALFGIATFSPMGMPLLALKQNATEAYANASRAQVVRYKSVMRYMVGNKNVEAACAKNVAGPRCKLGTLSETSARHYKAAGFKIDGTSVGGRWIVRSMTAPDGTVMRSGDSFLRKMTTDLKFSQLAMRAHNPANNVFNGGEWLKKHLVKLGLNKSPVPNLPEDKNERTKTVNKLAKLNEDGSVDREKARSNIQERAQKGLAGTDPDRLDTPEQERVVNGRTVKLARGMAAVPGLACMLYNSAKLIVNLAKIERGIYLASFVLPILKVADQMRDDGNDLTGTTTAQYANQLATPSNEEGMKGQTAMDAKGIKKLFGGDEKGLSEYARGVLLFNNEILKNADYLINVIDENIQKVPGVNNGVRGMCRIVNSWEGQLLGTAVCVAMPAIAGGVGAIGGTVVPGAGNIAGGLSGILSGAASCAGAVVAGALIEQGVNWYVQEWLVPWALESAVANLPNATSVGPPVGEAIAVGAAILLNGANRINGLTPTGKARLGAFNDATRESDAMTKQVEVAKARETPFDIYNQYSFLGSMMSGMHSMVYTPESRMQSGNFSLQRLFGAFSLAPSVMAIGESPSVIKASDLSADNCDSVLKGLGAECNNSGQLAYAMSPTALTMDVESSIAWLEERGQIDEVGAAVSDAEPIRVDGIDYTYERYEKFCAERETEIGITTEPIESDVYDWSLGKNCFYKDSEQAKKEVMEHFEAYRSLITAIEDAKYTEEEGGGTEVNVMSYNILGTAASIANDNSGGIQWRERLNSAVSAVKDASPDVVGFQEVTGAGTQSQFSLLKEGLADTYTGFPETETNYSPRVIYWKSDNFTLLDSGTYSYPRNGTTGVFPWVKLRENTDGKEFYVFNTHTSAGGAGETRYGSNQSPPLARRDQARRLVAAIRREVLPGVPVVITGDFNATCEKTGNDDGVTLAEIPCTIMKEAGFNSASEIAHQQGKTTNFEYATSHGEPNSFNINRGGKGRHIDHVFYSSEFNVLGWENLINTNTERASDHTPVVAALRMSGKPNDNVATGGCPAGTTVVDGITDGWERNGTKKQITLCTIPGTRVIDSSATPHWRDARYKGTTAAGIKQIAVNADSAAALLKLAQDAKQDGVTLTATIGYRSLYEQCSIVIKRYRRPGVCPSWITPVTGNWSSNATYSNHMMGYSIDFHGGSISWMKRNGPRCGFIDDVFRAQGWDQPHFTNKGDTPASCGISSGPSSL